MNEQERDALLVRVDDRTKRIAHVIDGNGRPGLIERMASIEQEVDDLKESKVSRKERFGVVGVVLVASASLVARLLGVPLPL